MKKIGSKGVKVLLASLFLLVTGLACFGLNGDVNNSSSVDINDALLLARYTAGLSVSGFNAVNADTNCDSTININDALVIARYVAGLGTICAQVTPTPTRTPTPTPTPTRQTVKGSEVLIIGESVIAMTHEITGNLNTLLRNNTIIAQNEGIRDNAVSGTRLSGGFSPTIPQQYANAKTSSPVKWVFMDGGGNDCLQGNCPSPVSSSCQDLVNARNAAQTLLNQMGADGVHAVIYFWYYDAPNDPREKLNVLRPMIQNVVNSTTTPKTFWLDLRPIFSGHPEYIAADGLHPSSAGCQAIANALWDVARNNNFFGL